MSELSEVRPAVLREEHDRTGKRHGLSLSAFEETRSGQGVGTHGKSSLGGFREVGLPEAAYNVLLRLFCDVLKEGGVTLGEFRSPLEASEVKFAKVAIKTKRRILFIDPADVIAVESQGSHVVLLRQSDSQRLRHSISIMEAHLKPYGFLRIHRSVLVNAAWVEEIQPSITGDCLLLRVSGNKEYSVSRTYRKNLRCLAQSWIGTDFSGH